MRNFCFPNKLKKSLLWPVPVLLAAMLLCTVTLSAQSIDMTATDVTIREVIENLQKEYGYSFSIRMNETDVTKRVSFSVENADIGSVLKKIFAGMNVTYSIEGNIISVTEASSVPPKPEPEPDRQIEIRGVVVDEAGEPVVGATVVVTGTMQGTATGVDGTFRLRTTRRNPVLQVAYTGMTSAEVAVDDPAVELRVQLHPDDRMIDDVVVIGYGTQRRSMVTNAIAKFRPDESNMLSALSPAEMLQGRVAGVSISSSSGNLGTANRVSIRGASSINASNEPLYVLDGMPLNPMAGSLYSFGEDLDALSVLNLTDIESIEILKDAASAAIYGSRANNGVIMITTKQGREGRSDIRLNYTFGLSMFPDKNRIEYADSRAWVRIYNEGIDNYNRQTATPPPTAAMWPISAIPSTDCRIQTGWALSPARAYCTMWTPLSPGVRRRPNTMSEGDTNTRRALSRQTT